MRTLSSSYVLRPDQAVRRVLRHRQRGATLQVRLLCGAPITVDTSDGIGWGIARSGVHEAPVSEAIWRLTAPGELALDVGANIGYFSALLSRRGAEVKALEPHPQLAESLVRNSAAWPGVSVTQAAASDFRGTAPLSMPSAFDENHGLATLEAEPGNPDTIVVQTVRLDDLIGDKRVGVLKIDVEGHELTAFAGAERALSEGRIRDVIFEELDPLPSPVSTLLESYGYELFSLAECRRGVSLGRLDAPPPRFHAPTFLATLDSDRARHLVRPDGWRSFRPR